MARHETPYSSFPATCQVRGCRASPQEWYQHEQTMFEVCHEHGLHLRAGESRSVADRELLLGPDSAPEVLGVHHTRTVLGILLTLRLGHHGVCTQEITVQDTPALRSALRTLLAHEDGPGPERPD